MSKTSSFSFGNIIYIVIFLGVAAFAQLTKPPKPPACTEPIQYDVVLFGDRWCPYYKDVRSFLREKNIEFCQYDIEQSSRAQTLHKGLGKPVLVVKGKVLHRFHEPTLLNMLKDD